MTIPKKLLILKEKNEYLIHAGDLCIEKFTTIRRIRTNLKYLAVLEIMIENLLTLSSKYNIKSEPYYFKIEDKKFKLMHLPYYINSW